ncbi:hypothetical protein [Parasitella parasitica]|uniref:HMG box domain-containing protein n=1 Tax=Parasitella parasitica TaxID=35722 RepID=A0A0B7MSF8_9FUNG|nr:hypothetical protein [Parasitella parasitica]
MVLQVSERNRMDQVLQSLTKNLKDFTEIILNATESIADGAGSASTAAEKAKKKKAEKDPNAPKRPLSSYMLYSQSVRADVVKKNPKLSSVDVARLIGEMWNALSDKEKQPFSKAAEKEKIRFQKEMAEYEKKGKATSGEPADSSPVKRKAEEPSVELAAEKKDKKKSKKSSNDSSSSDASAPTRYNHDAELQDVDILELVPVEQVIKAPLALPPPPPPSAAGTKHAGRESTDHPLEAAQEDVARNVSNTNTLSSIICVVAGTGILAIAHALGQSGWVGLVYLVASACMSHFTGIILIKCLYAEKCHGSGRLQDYADIGLAAFGKPGQVVGWVFSQAFLFLTPTIYMILASENISDILAQNGFVWLGRRVCVWLIAVVVGVPFLLVRNMRDVSFLSTFASLCTACLLLVVCVVAMSSSDYTAAVHSVHHDIAIPKNIPIAFSTFSFSYCGHVIYPHLEASMITPKRWSKVLLVSTCVVSIMYFTMGLVCYLVFGNSVQSPVYKSLPAGSSQSIAMFVITVHVLLAIPFYLYVFTKRIELWLRISDDGDGRLMRTALRMVQIVVCGIFAMFVPYFSDFMALVGTILSDTLSFVLPSVFWLKLNWHRHPQLKTDYEAIVCCIVALMGVFCATFGTIDAAKQLYHDYW